MPTDRITKQIAQEDASASYRILRSAVYAAIPGKQRSRNLTPALDAAVRAVARVIRRRHR